MKIHNNECKTLRLKMGGNWYNAENKVDFFYGKRVEKFCSACGPFECTMSVYKTNL